MRKWLAVLLTAAAAAGAVGAQSPGPPERPTEAPAQGPTFKTGIDLVTVDVAVLDRQGRPVEDLRAPEFSVKIDGELRKVVTAELVKVDVEAAKRQVADKTETYYTSNLTPPNGRQIIIAVDQLNIRPGSLRPVMDAAGKFLDKLSPLDEVAFVAFPAPGPRVGFTRDKLRLRLAMQSLIGSAALATRSDFNIGVAEAVAISDQGDALTFNNVVNRECRGLDPRRRAQCQEDVIDVASQIASRTRQSADESMREIRQLLERLAYIDGPKSLILISEGLAAEEQGEMTELVRLAGRARTTISVLIVDLRRGDITVAEQPPSEVADRRIQVRGLEALAMMSRGAMYQIVGTGEPIFDRLASEMSAHYILGVEQRPRDLTGDRHRIDVEVRRQNVVVRSRQAFVLSPTVNARRSAEDSLRDALTSPFAVSGLPVRVTTFATQDPTGSKVRVMVAGQVGQPGTPAGDYTVGFLVINDQNQVVASYGDRRRLAPLAGSPTEALEFSGAVDLEPGIYSLRFGVVDAEGRRGSVVREVNAWKMKGEELALGDLIVGNVPAANQGIFTSVEPHITGDTLAAYMELYSSSAATWTDATVTFDVADDPDGPALTSSAGQLTPGKLADARVATAAIAARALPPGKYVARAQIKRGGKTVGVLSRPFVLERAAAAADAAPDAIAAAAISFASTVPRFDRAAALSLMPAMLDMVEKQSPALTDAMTEARAGRFGTAALEALTAGDQTTASFLRGVDAFMKGQLDDAATQLNLASGLRREFFPAAFYLGAVYASVGRDRDAAGVWQIALGKEPRPPLAYLMVADARLRDGHPDSAIDILEPVFAREPGNVDVARRLASAYMITRAFAQAIPVLDAVLARDASDQDMLLASVIAHYEATRAGALVLSNVARAKLRKYAAAYKGPQRALVDKYLDTMR